MMIQTSTNQSQSDFVRIECSNFFKANRLTLKANGSIIVNLWTSNGKPAYITNGLCNSKNNTITLTLNSFSIGELELEPFASLCHHFFKCNKYNRMKEITILNFFYFYEANDTHRSICVGGFILRIAT